jgi:hypothetical protein
VKNICVIILYILILTAANEMIYAQAVNNLQAADSFYVNRKWAAAKMIYLKYPGDSSKNSMIWNRPGFVNRRT